MSYEALATYAKDRKDFSNNEDRSSMEEKWANGIKAYNNFVAASYSGHTKINVPESFATSFRIFSAFNADIRSNPELAQFIPYPKTLQDGLIAVDSSKAFQNVSDYYINQNNVLKDVSNFLLEAVTLGTAHARTTWDAKTDSPIIKHRPLENIRLDPKIIPSQKSPWEGEFVIDTSFASFDSLKQNDKFFNLSQVNDKVTKKSPTQDNSSIVRQAYDTSLALGMEGVEERDRQSDMVVVDEYWGMVPRRILTGQRKQGYSGTDLKDYVLAQVIMAEGVVIFASESPYEKIPYDVFRCYPRTNFYYGIGVPELIRDLQRVLNGIVNQRMDNVSLILNRMWKYRAGMVNPKLLVSRPGGAVPVTGDVRGSLEPIETPDVTQSSYAEQQNIGEYIQKSTGAADIFFGTTNKFNETATEVQTKTELGAGMLQEIIAGMVRDGFIPMMSKWRDLILDFQTEPVSVLTGGQVVTINPEDFSTSYALIPSIGDKMFTKPAEFNKAMAMFQVAAQAKELLAMEGTDLKLTPIFEKVYTNAGYKDKDAVITQAQQQPGLPGQPQTGQEVGSQGVLGGSGAIQGDSGIPPELAALLS